MSRGRPRGALLRAALLGALALASPARAEDLLRIDPARSTVRFRLAATLHTVDGEGRVLSGELRFDPAGGAASGAVVVDARSFQTGVAARDRNMHEQVLESGRFPEIRFEAERLELRSRSADAAEVTLHGVFEIHGARQPLAVPARVEREGDGLRIAAAFRVPYVRWGLRDVSTFVLRVAPEVDVQLALWGVLASEAAESRAAP
jgi:polyisoprenoid-binding protein YceI